MEPKPISACDYDLGAAEARRILDAAAAPGAYARQSDYEAGAAEARSIIEAPKDANSANAPQGMGEEERGEFEAGAAEARALVSDSARDPWRRRNSP